MTRTITWYYLIIFYGGLADKKTPVRRKSFRNTRARISFGEWRESLRPGWPIEFAKITISISRVIWLGVLSGRLIQTESPPRPLVFSFTKNPN